jgi:hypothetical protein
VSDLLLGVLPWSLIGPDRDQKLYVATLALLTVGSLLALVAVRLARLEVVAAAVAGGAVAAWLLSNGPGEGGTLLIVFPGNGLTLADLAAVPAAALVLVLSVRRARAS